MIKFNAFQWMMVKPRNGQIFCNFLSSSSHLVLPVVCSMWGLRIKIFIICLDFSPLYRETINMCNFESWIDIINGLMDSNQGYPHHNILISMVGLTWASVSKARSSISISQRFELSSGSTPDISMFKILQYLKWINSVDNT